VPWQSQPLYGQSVIARQAMQFLQIGGDDLLHVRLVGVPFVKDCGHCAKDVGSRVSSTALSNCGDRAQERFRRTTAERDRTSTAARRMRLDQKEQAIHSVLLRLSLLISSCFPKKHHIRVSAQVLFKWKSYGLVRHFCAEVNTLGGRSTAIVLQPPTRIGFPSPEAHPKPNGCHAQIRGLRCASLSRRRW